VLQGYKDAVGFGARANFSDSSQLHRAHLTASFSPSRELAGSEEAHLEAEYARPGWTARARFNPADFYDLFGPTKRGRKGWNLGLKWEKYLVYDPPRQYDVSLRSDVWGGLERLPDYQNVATPVGTLFTTTARIHGRFVRSSLGHVDDEKGLEWDVVVDQTFAEGRGYFRSWADLDFGTLLPIGHSSVWLRNSAGFSPGDPARPYSNFFFGGFGNNWVDRGTEKRYREQDAFPGLEIDEVGGRSYARSLLELNLPPLRFRRAGKPGFYLTWARPALFASGLVTSLDDASLRRQVANVGAQVDLQFTVLSALDMTLSAGYARAFEDGRAPRREVMVSLKLFR
jgi:hypothetical protein